MMNMTMTMGLTMSALSGFLYILTVFIFLLRLV